MRLHDLPSLVRCPAPQIPLSIKSVGCGHLPYHGRVWNKDAENADLSPGFVCDLVRGNCTSSRPLEIWVWASPASPLCTPSYCRGTLSISQLSFAFLPSSVWWSKAFHTQPPSSPPDPQSLPLVTPPHPDHHL